MGPRWVVHCKIGAQASVDALGTIPSSQLWLTVKLWGFGGEGSMRTVPGLGVGAHDP